MNKSQGVGLVSCVISSAGTIATAFFVNRCTKKSMENVKVIDNKIDFIKNHLKTYAPAYVSGGITLVSNMVGCIHSYKAIAGLTTTIAGLGYSAANYKNIVKKTVGEEQYNKIVQKVVGDTQAPDGKKVYYNEYTGVFVAREEDIALAQKRMNDVLNDKKSENVYYIADFLKDAKAVLRDPEDFKPYEKFGWYRSYLMECYEKSYVHAIESDDERIEYNDNGSNKIQQLNFAENPIYFEVERHE